MIGAIKIYLHLWCFIIGVKSSGFGSPSMPPTILTLQMIIDFVEEESWKQVVFFDCIGTEDCNRPYARPLLECFFKKGVLVTIKSLTDQTDLSKVLRAKNSRVGVVLLLDDVDLENGDNVLRKVIMKNKGIRTTLLGEYTSWLIVSTKWNNTQIFDTIKEWPVGVDSDVTIAMSFLPADVILTVLHQFENKTCDDLRIYGQSYDYERLRRSQSVFPPEATFVQDTEDTSRTIMVFYMVGVYKIRMDENASLEKEDWNFWSPSRQFINKEKNLLSRRKDLRMKPMKFGMQNSSKLYGDEVEGEGGTGDHEGSLDSFMELVNLFETCLNVSANVTTYSFHESAESTKDNKDLVHAITGGDVDVGFYLDSDLYRNKLLHFSYPITHFQRSIFFKTLNTTSNIFLQPFSPRLLGCVIITLALIVMVMEIINYVTVFIHWKEDAAHFGIGEATLWCLSIICMQGSPWTPTTRAGKTVLLASLMFALIIYNSFSGYITSILSFKDNMIHNVSDFSNWDFVYGCSKSEESFIIEIPELRNFYVKTLESNQVKLSDKEGLKKVATDKNYIFFVAETVAKRIFRGALMFQRCEVDELIVAKTQGKLALPMSTNSPYKKIINVSILRMWQHGILAKLNRKIKPKMLDCKKQTYKEASFLDVYFAFEILGAGAVASILLFFCERTWASRQSLQRRITGRRSQQPGEVLRRQPQSVLVTARLPMKILGIDREIQTRNEAPVTERKMSALKMLMTTTRKISQNIDGNSALFPYHE